MSTNPSPEPRSRKLLPVVLGLFAGMLLLSSVAALAFYAGRATASPQTIVETVVEEVPVEVTRQVEVLVAQDDSAAQPTAVAPTAEPLADPAPTATPLPAPEREMDPDEIDFATFYEVWNLINADFDGDVPSESELLYSAISGSLESLDDDYTRFLNPELAARMREDMGGSVSGIGAFVRENDDGLFEIVRPIDGQPADLAGLQAGDIISAVDGESVLEMNFDEVILLVRGPEGSTVVLTVVREGETEPLEFTIVRTTFEVPTVESEMLGTAEQPIAYVKLSDFNRNAESKMLEALNTLLPQNPVGLILDLRDNPGGFLDQSVAVADIFLPQSTVLHERNIRGLDETFSADDGDMAETIPLVVLINAGSASASEIVAGAIQDNGRGVLIGETSFGKGSVQQIYSLSDGSELRVTIARWYTPSEKTIDKEGITPDIVVETPPDLGEEDDPQIQRALDFLLNGQ